MVSSARPVFACLLFVLTASLCAKSQTVPEKGLTGTISGKVTMKGNGVSGIVVGLVLNDNYRTHTTRLTATTGEDGNYRITNVPSGNYDVAVSAPAYASARRTLIIGKADTVENIDFALVRGGVITGKVTDSEGRPIIETEVNVSPVQMEEGLRVQGGIRTDDRGIYRAFGLKAGKYRVSAGRDEMSSFGDPWSAGEHKLTYYPAAAEASDATIIEVAEGGETADIDITLGRTTFRYSAYGRIVDGETGKPVAGVNYGVNMYATPRYGGSRSGGMTTNQNGEFKLQNLAPGSYAVTGEPPPDSDWRVEPLRFQIVDQDVTGLEVKTSKGASVAGVIVLDGPESRTIPMIGRLHVVGYSWTSKGPRGSNHIAKVTPDGNFSIRGLPGGNVNIWISGPDRLQVVRMERDGIAYGRGIEIKDFEQVSGVRVVVEYANGTIRGVVKTAKGLLPADTRYSVQLKRISADPESWNSTSTTHVDARGNFIGQWLLPGTYEVALVPYLGDTAFSGKQPLAVQQVLVTLGNVSNVTLTLPRQ